MVCIAGKRIRDVVVADIHHQVQILTTYRFFDDALSFTGSKTRNTGSDKESIFLIAGKGSITFKLMSTFMTPFYEIIIHFLSQLFTASKGNNSKTSNRDIF